MGDEVQLDWNSATYLADPYPFLHRLRSRDPIHRHQSGFWLVTRYDDALAILRDRRFIRGIGPGSSSPSLQPELLSPVQFLLAYGILWQDPPDHTRLRRLLNKAFTPAVVDELRPKIEEMVVQLLDGMGAGNEIELIAEFAYPLPVMVIAELLGVPTEDRDDFRQWSRDLAGAFDPARDADARQRGQDAIAWYMDFFRKLINERRTRPRNDLISAMIAAQEAGEGLSESELLANAIFLFVAGHETTIGLLGNGILALIRAPDELARLRDDPTLVESAVEELLRYDSSQQTIFFTVAEEVSWGDRLIRPGETVLIMVGAVNRDPARFPDPDRLDLARTDNRHLTFSHGIRYCLGAPLARAQAQIAIPALFRRFPDLALAGEPTWQETMFIRGLKSMPARVS